MKKGFTLIELLVVVLIIGILAAVALPKYNTAVRRSRYQQARMAAQTIHKAQKIYFMANGRYPEHFDELDISFAAKETVPGERQIYDWGYCGMRAQGSVQCQLSGGLGIEIFSDDTEACYASAGAETDQQVCRSETGHNNYEGTGSYFYKY